MKKFLFLGGIIALIIWAGPVSAATNFSVSPSSVNVNIGQTFKLTLAVDPQSVSNYTVKIELDYPADLLEVKSFSFAGSWTALSQPGYDLIDNESGHLIKTAGFPGGFSSPQTFGTVSFLSKKSGTGLIKITNSSLALDANNQNVSSNVNAQTQVNVSSAPPSPTLPSSQASTPAPSPEAIEVLGVIREEEESAQEPIIPQVSSKAPTIPNCLSSQKIDWLNLAIGFIDGILFMLVASNIRKHRQKR